MRIQKAGGGETPFNAWTPGQRKIYAAFMTALVYDRPVRINCLKSRRQGVSTLVQFLKFWRLSCSGFQSGMGAAHEDDAANTLYRMFEQFLDCYPEFFQLMVGRRSFSDLEITFENPKAAERAKNPGLKSRAHWRTVAPGGGKKENAGKGRSQAVHFFGGSEVAFWDEPDTFWSGASSCIEDEPGTVIIFETTANGFGWYSEQWAEAAKGWEFIFDKDARVHRWACTDRRASRSDMVPVFLSWLEEPRYRQAFETEEDERHFMRQLDPEESLLVETYGATSEQLHWRQRRLNGNKFNGNLNRFHQEYPTTPEEAFVSSGVKVFDIGALKAMEHFARTCDVRGKRCDLSLGVDQETIRTPADDGYVTIFREPDVGCTYAMGVDGSRGHVKGDFTAIKVLRCDTWEEVACAHGRMDPDAAAVIAFCLGRMYGETLPSGHRDEAIAVVEINEGSGLIIQREMHALGYTRMYTRKVPDAQGSGMVASDGWWTSTKTRKMLVSYLKSAIRDFAKGEGLILHDVSTVYEMMGWTLKRGKTGKSKEQPASSSGHDDRITATGLALVGGCIEEGHGAPIASKTVGNPEGTTKPERTIPVSLRALAWDKTAEQIPNHWNV